MNPAVHLNADREDLPSPATQIGSVLNPNLQTLRRTGNLQIGDENEVTKSLG